MGTQDVSQGMDGQEQRLFMKRLLNDVRALERMLDQGLIESGKRRIGAEQELFLVDRAYRPAPRSAEVLARLDDPAFTTELARFNMEFNLDPLDYGGDCLARMEASIAALLGRVREVAAELGIHVLLTGILPTLTPSDLGMENMTENPRYYALNEALSRMRGHRYEFRIKGTDELLLRHDSVMPEACNTSFQIHFQVAPAEFAKLYNIAQATVAPVLAAAVNSPLLFGRRLWAETRIALFQQALDTRRSRHDERSPRVAFGRQWVDGSVVELFKEDIARFRVLLGTEVEEDPFIALAQGRPPTLKALRLHNSTVYRWNRVCYGINDGVAHIRIENRVLPAGPTILDEMANAAFWFGLMSGLSDQVADIREVMDFDDAKGNFLAAARQGLNAHMTWVGGRTAGAGDLIREELLPLAREGLQSRGIRGEDVDRYLGVIEERVARARTGASWLLHSLARMKDVGTRFERLSALAAATIKRQESGEPVHRWELAAIDEARGFKQHYLRVEQIMLTDLFTVHENDLVDLVAALMDWKHIRYVPVEDDENRLVGLVSPASLLRLVGQDLAQHRGEPRAVSEVMHRRLITVSPDTPTLEAIRIMQREGVGCLPVVDDERLVGLVTDRCFLHVSAQLLEKEDRQPEG